MTRRLILMRHGNADPGYGLQDHERPLTTRGQAEARSVGRALVEAGWVPELVRGSDAARTQQTWVAMKSLFPKVESSWTRSLYLPLLEDVVADAANWEADIETVLCLGHNPGWSDAASQLSGQRIGMGTAYAALLRAAPGSWSNAFCHQWELEGLLTPSV